MILHGVKHFCRRYSLAQAKTMVQSQSSLDKALKYSIGDHVCGYVVKQIADVPELQLVALRLEHEKTGADHLHIARDDKNNVFSVNFKTIPQNSRGAPHILEHLALCGSQRFPCRDPFFKMLNRSLSTFMNAFTGLDSTMYPFSTQNVKDFENLLQVYLDAAFFPRLREKDFLQEAWRLDHEEVGNKNSPIILKGVVYNEMKGIFSDPSQCYTRELLRKLYPSHAYSHISGGHPLNIPEITWQELKAFHAKYYHPSNGRFFTYGNFPMESHLELIDKHCLSKFMKAHVPEGVEPEKCWSTPREMTIHCQFNPMAANPQKQTTISHSYLLNEITDSHESFTMSIIGNLLVNGPNSPFYKSLLEPGIGADYSPLTGHEGQLKQGFFSIGLREVSADDLNLVKSQIESTFDGVVKEGFPKERIDGILHNIELSLKHQTTKFGLNAAMVLNDLWNHGGNPIESLKINAYIHHFQEQLKTNPLYLQDKVDQYFRKNNHRLCLIMTPNELEENKMKEEEQNLLKSKLSQLSNEDKEQILKIGIELSEYQQTVEDLSCLPTVKISDVEKMTDRTPITIEKINDVSVQLCEQQTNGVTYFKALCKVPELPEDLLLLLPLFSGVVTKMGAGDLDYRQFDQEVELKTGGLSASVHLTSHPFIEEQFEHGILFSSYSLQRNFEPMMDLWLKVFNSLKLLDHERLSQLIKISAAELAESLPQNGHLYAMIQASSCLNKCLQLKEKMSGLTQILFMKKLAEMTDYNEIIVKLKTLSHIILNKNGMRCSLNSNSESMSSSVSILSKFLHSLDNSKENYTQSIKDTMFHSDSKKCHFVIPFAVNYISQCVLTKPYAHEDFSSIKVASQLLSSKFLHTEIREKGGAYGGGSKLELGGAMMFYSYRDPNVTQTLKSFENGLNWLVEGSYSTQDITEAKLSVFKEIDHPISPGSKGSSQFLLDISDDMRQNFREHLFSVSKEDVIEVAKKYLLQSKTWGTTLIGPKNDISNNNKWTIISE